MSYRSDVDALVARQAALAVEVQDKIRERDAAERLLEEARARERLPILDNIRVATPCSADWNAMTGDERARLCGQCDRHVYDISGLTRDQAEELIIEKEGVLCVRYFQRADGTILLADCEIGLEQKRRRRLFAAGAAATLAAGGMLGYELARPEKLERMEPAAVVQPAPETIPMVPIPAPQPPIMVEGHTAGVPPVPTAEQRLRYKQLKQERSSRKTKR